MPGVRGLAAMFEQRGDASPPDLSRGRSPNALSGTPPLSDSPRPLSKIRTQFVAVEKDGRLGLTRGISTDSITSSSRRTSNETGTTTPQPRSEPTSDPFTETPAALSKATPKPISIPQSQPQSPQKPLRPVGRMSPLKKARASTPEVMPNANPDKITDEEETKTKLLPGLPTDKLATRGSNNAVSNGIGDSLTSANPPVVTPAPTPAPAPVAQAEELITPKTTSIPAKPRLAPVSTAKTASKAPKSPLASKVPKSPLPPKAPKSPTKDTPKAPTLAPSKKTSITNLRETHKKLVAATSAPVPTNATSTAKKPASLKIPQNGTSVVKPKVKSPTRPIKLPPGLTSHTTSSSSRTNAGAPIPAPAQPAKRSQSLAPRNTSQRPASRVSTAAPGDRHRTLRRQSSSIHGPHQGIGSIGPPPKQVEKETGPKKDYHVDEGFLARMMRPTQSSANKTTDKAPVTPPRRQAAPKAASKHAVSSDATASAKKAAAKIQASGRTRSQDAGSPRQKNIGPSLDTVITSAVPEAVAMSKVESDLAETSSRASSIKAPELGLEEQMASLVVQDEAQPVESEGEHAQPSSQVATESMEAIARADKPTKINNDSEAAAPVETVPKVTSKPLIIEDIEDIVREVPEQTEVSTSRQSPTINTPPTLASSDETTKLDDNIEEDSKEGGADVVP
ncbi:hypothetical protein MN608_10493 [Microdochium nivale]|nr:hypothetical protein MN608_10493 [Microdochium nivale]